MNSTNKSRIDGSRCAWLGSSKSSKLNDTIGSITHSNNSWYCGERGERPEKIVTGRIAPERVVQRPAWNQQDKYTKSRNPANDFVRYSYIEDCTDEIRRDVALRFSAPPKPESMGAFAVLPKLRDYRAPNQALRAASAASDVNSRARFEMNGYPLTPKCINV